MKLYDFNLNFRHKLYSYWMIFANSKRRLYWTKSRRSAFDNRDYLRSYLNTIFMISWLMIMKKWKINHWIIYMLRSTIKIWSSSILPNFCIMSFWKRTLIKNSNNMMATESYLIILSKEIKIGSKQSKRLMWNSVMIAKLSRY